MATVVPDRDEEPGDGLPVFFGSSDGPEDLAERSSAILRAEFPHRG